MLLRLNRDFNAMDTKFCSTGVMYKLDSVRCHIEDIMMYVNLGWTKNRWWWSALTTHYAATTRASRGP